MGNIFLARPDALSVETKVEQVRLLKDGRQAVVFAENPMRPSGGGQPADHGAIVTTSCVIEISDVLKLDGVTWVVVSAGTFQAGEPVLVKVDPARRHLLSQCHSLTHLMMAAIREVVEGYESKGADIFDCGQRIELRFRSSDVVTLGGLDEIDRRTRNRIAQDLPITVTRATSIEDAAMRFERWRIDPDLNLGGKIRVISIEGVDANPCSGSHVASTAAIGPYCMIGNQLQANGINVLTVAKRSAWPESPRVRSP